MVFAPYERKKRENNINCRSCRRDLYLEINIADLRKVFACTVTYTSSKAIYKADKNLFASHSNYESELQHSPSLDNLETEKASIPYSQADWCKYMKQSLI